MAQTKIDYNNDVIGAITTACQKAREILNLKIPQRLKLLVAVSGGEDSVVLLHALVTLSSALKLDLVVLHVDHGLREESKKEALFVKTLAEQMSLTFLFYQAPTRADNENIEAWARKIRYNFFLQSLKNLGAHFVVTAHHLNDQAETLLFRMLSGRLETSSYSIAALDQERRLLRPLLSLPKKAIREYRKIYQLSYLEDKSNYDRSYKRNLIRHELSEKLRKDFNPNLEQALSSIALRLNEDEQELWTQAKKELDTSIRQDFSYLKNIPAAIRWRTIKLLANRQIGEDAGKLSYRAIKEVDRLLFKDKFDALPIDLGFNISCYLRKREGLVFIPTKKQEEKEYSYNIVVPAFIEHRFIDYSGFRFEALFEKVEQGGIKKIIDNAVAKKCSAPEEFEVYFDWGLLKAESLILRSRKDGDTVNVWKRGNRKLKKLLQEKGVALTERGRVPIIEATEILWIPGIVRANIAPVSESTTKIVKFKFAPLKK